MQTSDNIQSYLPLTEVTYLILLSLASEPKHGYAIMKDVHYLSQERVSLSTGTLYGALKRLLDQGWILRADDPEPNHSGRVRKSYRLTDMGCSVLKAEVERLDHLVAAAQLRAVGESV
jgi:DNA-binding PadR family transcriptional regulator